MTPFIGAYTGSPGSIGVRFLLKTECIRINRIRSKFRFLKRLEKNEDESLFVYVVCTFS